MTLADPCVHPVGEAAGCRPHLPPPPSPVGPGVTNGLGSGPGLRGTWSLEPRNMTGTQML